jgi:hypothetical protein
MLGEALEDDPHAVAGDDAPRAEGLAEVVGGEGVFDVAGGADDSDAVDQRLVGELDDLAR